MVTVNVLVSSSSVRWTFQSLIVSSDVVVVRQLWSSSSVQVVVVPPCNPSVHVVAVVISPSSVRSSSLVKNQWSSSNIRSSLSLALRGYHHRQRPSIIFLISEKEKFLLNKYTIQSFFSSSSSFSSPRIPSSPFLHLPTISPSTFPHFRNDAITLTQDHPCSSSSSSTFGRALYFRPFCFLGPKTNSTASFSSRFIFSIIQSLLCPPVDDLAFLITSSPNSVSLTDGFMGLPAPP
ncbi:L-type lectin-domain containing receptor kinase S.6 [Linum grandiflorum]